MGTNEMCADFLDLVAGRLPLAGIIGLTDRRAGDDLSGFVPMRPLAERHGLAFVGIDGYGLTRADDKARLSALDIDILLVIGWQRLVPGWLIERCAIGVIGAHGSPDGISGGRGRSPQNWAIMLGASSFDISIFFVDAGVDTGDVIAARRFPLAEDEDIVSSYAKVVHLTASMVIEAWSAGTLAARRAVPQPRDGYYLPQRLPEDGAIDWGRDAQAVCAFVRALTRPYPGAWSRIDGRLVRLWGARPFDPGEPLAPGAPGEVVMALSNGRLVVATGRGLVMVDDCDCAGAAPRRGDRFETADFKAQMQAIVGRHRAKYPDFPLSPAILRAAGL